METVTKTVREVYEALEKNGYEHLRGVWFDYMGHDKPGGCVLAQSAMNLGVYGWNAIDDGSQVLYRDNDWDLGSPENNTIVGQLDRWHVPSDSKWRSAFAHSKGLGSHIIYWNDLTEAGWLADHKRGTTYDLDESLYDQYHLKTYKEVADMAREILEPHFDEEVTLAVYDYGFATA